MLAYNFILSFSRIQLISFCFCRRDLEQAGEVESLKLEGDIGGGLIIHREIYFPKDDPKIFRIDSGIVARKVGAGSGGFSRLNLISSYVASPMQLVVARRLYLNDSLYLKVL